MMAPSLPLTTASVIMNSAYTLHTKDAAEPSATSVSMLGARCHRLLKPETKNFWLITITMAASSSCARPMAT